MVRGGGRTTPPPPHPFFCGLPNFVIHNDRCVWGVGGGVGLCMSMSI